MRLIIAYAANKMPPCPVRIRRAANPSQPATGGTLAATRTGFTAMVAVAALLLAAVMLLVAWRTAVGALTVFASGETSMIMGFPSWIGYAFMVPGFALLATAGFYMCLLRLRMAFRSDVAHP